MIPDLPAKTNGFQSNGDELFSNNNSTPNLPSIMASNVNRAALKMHDNYRRTSMGLTNVKNLNNNENAISIERKKEAISKRSLNS
jgi:hypothetical protein